MSIKLFICSRKLETGTQVRVEENSKLGCRTVHPHVGPTWLGSGSPVLIYVIHTFQKESLKRLLHLLLWCRFLTNANFLNLSGRRNKDWIHTVGNFTSSIFGSRSSFSETKKLGITENSALAISEVQNRCTNKRATEYVKLLVVCC